MVQSVVHVMVNLLKVVLVGCHLSADAMEIFRVQPELQISTTEPSHACPDSSSL
jgi:hypothetical protein